MTVGLDERKRRAMAKSKSSTALKHLETLFNVGTIGTLTDGQLLERFATDRGECRELAFAARSSVTGRLCCACAGGS